MERTLFCSSNVSTSAHSKFSFKYPNGKVISHPECNFDVCSNSDFVGSTEYIINTIKDSEPGSHWLVGTRA